MRRKEGMRRKGGMRNTKTQDVEDVFAHVHLEDGGQCMKALPSTRVESGQSRSKNCGGSGERGQSEETVFDID